MEIQEGKEGKSIIEEIYKMDIDTLRKYCLRLLRENAEYFRLSRKPQASELSSDAEKSPDDKHTCPIFMIDHGKCSVCGKKL